MITKVFVKDLKDKEQVDSVFLVKTKSTPLAKNGKPYLAMMLGDRTGALEGRMWDNVDAVVNTFSIDDYVRIRGTVNLYQKRRQLVISEITKVSKKDISPSDFLPISKQDPEIMFKNLIMIVKGMKNKYLRQLVLDTLEDPEIKPKYLRCPAARTIHHAWIGGLLEHTLSISKIMVFLSTHYEDLDLDLLLVGAVFHDIGKVWELSYDGNISYTDAGKLVGHLVMGSELIDTKAKAIKGFPDELRHICKHIVLSHHGKLEYGSPKLPQTMEAMIVGYIDDLDSKISALQTFLFNESSKGDTWTGYNSVFDRYFFMPKKLQEPPTTISELETEKSEMPL
ncbi:MAG: HD domain-containing protein [Oligoflexia bacterium]|nr:HD domain-containing protein [Oligoflexia bacterium]